MSLDKKITFSGVDNFSSTFQKFNQEQKKVYSTLVEEARKQAGSSKDQLAFMQQYVRELEKAEKIEKRRQDIQNKFEYQKSMRGAKNAEERSNISSKYQANQAEGQIAGLDFSELVNNLKTLAEESKKQTKAQEDQRKTQGEKEESRLSLWAQEVKDNKKGVEANIAAAKAGRIGKLFGGKDFDNVSEEQKDKLRYQQQLLRSDPNQGGGKESIFGSILKAEAVKELFNTVKSTATSVSGAQDENFLVGKLAGAITKVSGSLLAAGAGAVVGAIPFIGGAGSSITAGGIAGSAILGDVVQGNVERNLEERKKRDIAGNQLISTTGKGGFSASQYGLATYQTAEIAKQVAISYGSSANLQQRTINSLAVEKAYGLDRGTINQQNQNARITGVDSIKNIATVVATLQGRGEFKGGDYSKLSEILQQQSSFIQNQSKILERPNANAATGIMAAFRSIGGSFGDTRSGERISTINSALANPSNDFQKARNFGILNKLNPGASYFQLKEMQEKGLEQKGFLGETLKQLQREVGGDPENLMIATQQRLGLSSSSTRKLVESFQKDPNIFNNMGIAGANKVAGIEDEIKNKRNFTTAVEQSSAEIADAYASGALEGFKVAFSKGFNKFSKELENYITSVLEGKTPKDPVSNASYDANGSPVKYGMFGQVQKAKSWTPKGLVDIKNK